MMNCRQAQNHLFASDEEALPENDRAALQRHLAGCQACRSIGDDIRAVTEHWRADVRRTGVPNPDIEWQKVRRNLASPAAVRPRALAWFGVPIAATAALAAVVIYLSLPNVPTPVATPHNAKPVAPAIESAVASTVVYVDDRSGWTFVLSPGASDRKS